MPSERARKQKFRSPRRYMPGTKLPDFATQSVEDRLFHLQREMQGGSFVRFYITDEQNTNSGLRGLHIVKTSFDDESPHGIAFDVITDDLQETHWEIGMDATSYDFVLAFDHSATNAGTPSGFGADILRFSRAEDDEVSGSRSTKAILSYLGGTPAANTAFFTVEAGSTLSGINLSVENSASGRSSITITQRAANHWGAISFDNALRIGCDYAAGDAATFFIRDDVAGAHRLWMDASGRFSFGPGTSPTATVHIKAGTATASSAPLKFTSGTNLTTAEAGAFEYDGTNLYFTPSGTTRRTIDYLPASPPDYTTANVTPNRSIDADTIILTDLADVVGTLIDDLIAQGRLS